MLKVTYELTNGEARAAASPKTFKIPPATARLTLQPGDLAQADFSGMEKMWIEVIATTPTGYSGRLKSAPAVLNGIRRGDLVVFLPAHVLKIQRA